MSIAQCQEWACSTGLRGVGNRIALNATRNVLSEIDTREKAGRTPIHLDDAEITAMLQKEAAQYHEIARLYEEAGESERAATEIADAEVIEAYLPVTKAARCAVRNLVRSGALFSRSPVQ